MSTETAPVEALKRRLTRLAGWRRWAALGALGVMAALALPPLFLLPLLIPAFSGLLWTIEDSAAPGSTGRAFADGWWFGFGFSAAGLYWIGFSFFVDAAQFGWMAPFAISGMAAGMALFPAAAALSCKWIFSRNPITAPGRVLIFAALWTAAEWLRGWLLTGFLWNLIGTVWVVSDAMIQMAAVTGVYGLSLLAVASALMPAVLAEQAGRWRGIFVVGVAVAAVWVAGAGRLSQASNETVAGVRLRLVQPNISQALKWKPEHRRSHVLKQLAMSRGPAESGPPPTHVIWAETAVPYVINQIPGLLQTLGLAAPRGGLLLVGAPRSSPKGSKPPRLWNSLLALNSQGRITGTYDKFHLVPFGEYVPWRGFLPINKLTAGRQDFSPGPGPRTLKLDGLPAVSVLICYEVIFPGQVTAINRPAWLLNLTNDGWFGLTSGPYQHFAAARLRTVEEGLPLVRAANTGISGVVDGYGRIVHSLGLGREGVIDSDLPVALAAATPFSRLGNWMTVFLLVLALGAGLMMRRIVYNVE